MKKIIILAAAFCLSAAAFAQAPQKMSYQAVVRNASNTLVTGSPVGMRISVLQGSPTGTAVFAETHTPNTNANGLVSLEIGGGVAVSGSFSAIDWANGPYFIQTETDPTGGTNYTITGTSQFLSVPYALYAETSGTPGPQGPSGATGATGAAGQSAYQVWLATGNTGSEADFLTGLVGATGAQGIQGPAGNDGATGPQGIQGVPGNDGATGAQGIQGPAGVTGTTGATGQSAYQVWLAAGNTGTEANFLSSLIGAQGIQGPQGPQGNAGTPGSPGSMGMPGFPGAQGPQGATGAQGPIGNTGLSAYQVWLAAGNTGTEANFLSSLIGAQGIQGPVGATGPQGPQGNAGAPGSPGSMGMPGFPGAQGPQGATGAQGTAGTNGLSAYQIWLENGHVGTETDFLAALKGDQGVQGIQGPVGATGPQGPQGNAGAPGSPGSMGMPGFPGAQGPQGATGAQGPQGIQGPLGPQGPAGNDGATGPQGAVGTFQTGTVVGEMLFWNGSNWAPIAPPAANNRVLTYCYGYPTWTTGTCPALTVGANAYGGIVAYILQAGDPGYDPAVTHGLIVAPSDVSPNAIPWGPMDLVTGTATAFGTGPANTATAAAVIGSGNYAPVLCENLSLGGYSDWYLPSRFEMEKIYNNRALFNAGFFTGQYAYYFTSSEFPSSPESWVYVYDFSGAPGGTVPKIATYRAHAVRNF